MKRVGILGAGRQAAETAGYLKEAGYKIEFFFIESKYLDSTNPLNKTAPLVTEQDDLKNLIDTEVISAVGSATLRKKLIELWPYNNYFSFVHSSAWVSEDAKIGLDVTLPPGAIVNTNTIIGDHVLLNIGVTISHDSVLGDYSTISPGVHIAGAVKIGEACFFGTGANVIDHIKIGSGAVIAAGALVKDDVPDSVMVAGVPGIQKNILEGWH